MPCHKQAVWAPRLNPPILEFRNQNKNCIWYIIFNYIFHSDPFGRHIRNSLSFLYLIPRSLRIVIFVFSQLSAHLSFQFILLYLWEYLWFWWCDCFRKLSDLNSGMINYLDFVVNFPLWLWIWFENGYNLQDWVILSIKFLFNLKNPSTLNYSIPTIIEDIKY